MGKRLEELYIYSHAQVELLYNEKADLMAARDEQEEDFNIRVSAALQASKNADIEAIKSKYELKAAKISEKIRKAEARLERETEQAGKAKFNTMVDVGSTLLDSFLGGKKLSKTTANKAARTARSASRANQQSGDVKRAEADLEELQLEAEQLKADWEQELADLETLYEKYQTNTTVSISPLKGDINIKLLAVLYLPYKYEASENGGEFKALY